MRRTASASSGSSASDASAPRRARPSGLSAVASASTGMVESSVASSTSAASASSLAVGVVHNEQRRAPRLARPANRGGDGFRTAGRPSRTARERPARCSSPASSAARRVLPIPLSPVTVITAPAPSRARSQRSRSHPSSRSRPTSASAAPASSSRGNSAGSNSRERSWRRIASCNPRSSAPGSTPTSSTSNRRAWRNASKRLGLAPTAIQRQHPLGAQVLAQRMLERPAPRVRPPGRRGGRAPGRRRCAARARPRAAPPAERSRPARSLVGHVGQRRTAPQRKRLAQPGGRIGGTLMRKRLATLTHQPLEAVDVELARPQPAARTPRPRVCSRRPPRSSSARRSWPT